MKASLAIIAGTLFLAASATAQPMYSQGNRPVMLIATGEVDACSLGEIAETGPDESVMVFPGDSTDLDYVATLHGGSKVWICETSEESGMTGIVYSDDPEKDCGVSSPVEEDRPYLGPCDWGWIKSDLIAVTAG